MVAAYSALAVSERSELVGRRLNQHLDLSCSTAIIGPVQYHSAVLLSLIGALKDSSLDRYLSFTESFACLHSSWMTRMCG